MAASSKSSTTSSSGSSAVSLLILVGLFALVYVFFLRPRAQAARRQRDTLMELSAGDEVLTAAGIFGTVLDVQADRSKSTRLNSSHPELSRMPSSA